MFAKPRPVEAETIPGGDSIHNLADAIHDVSIWCIGS